MWILFSGKNVRLLTWYFRRFLSSWITTVTGNLAFFIANYRINWQYWGYAKKRLIFDSVRNSRSHNVRSSVQFLSPSKCELSPSKLSDSTSKDRRNLKYYVLLIITVLLPFYSSFQMHICDCSRLHGEDNVAIKRYVISFWNGVDLRYKLLQGPSVKISIAGIIISRVKNPRVSKYLHGNLKLEVWSVFSPPAIRMQSNQEFRQRVKKFCWHI